jgi:hypothetical protein
VTGSWLYLQQAIQDIQARAAMSYNLALEVTHRHFCSTFYSPKPVLGSIGGNTDAFPAGKDLFFFGGGTYFLDFFFLITF